MAIVSDVPDGSVMPAADCTADFDAVCERLGVRPKVDYITYKRFKIPKKRYRWVGLKLDSGRFAVLLKHDGIEEFEIELQRRGYGFYLSEIEEVRKFLKVRKAEIKRLDNGLKWL
jgi:hypothetical protein